MSETSYSEKDIQRIVGVISVELDDKFKAFTENVETIIKKNTRAIIQEKLVDIKADVQTIRFAVKDTNKQVHDHEQRKTALEAA